MASTLFKMLHISSTFNNITIPFFSTTFVILHWSNVFFFFHMLFFQNQTLFSSFFFSMLRMNNLFFIFKNKNCRGYHECTFEFTNRLIWSLHRFWLVHLNKDQLVEKLLTACSYYQYKCPLGMFKNVPHVENKIRLHVKYY